MGNQSLALGAFSVSFGQRGVAYLEGQISQSTINYTNANYGPYSGIGQASTVTPFRIEVGLTTGASAALSLDGSGTTSLVIPRGDNRVWNAKVETVAVVKSISGTATGITVGSSFMQDDAVLFKRTSGTSRVVGSNNSQLIADDSLANASVTYSAGASGELAINFNAPTFSGGGTLTFWIQSKVSLVEVSYG
jgi:hypothetical protein